MLNPSADPAAGVTADWQFPGFPGAYVHRQLYFSGVCIEELARQYGTPLYAYSAPAMLQALQSYRAALSGKGEVFFSVKSNSNLSILRLFQEQGAGVDVVSGGELDRALRAGFCGQRIVFSGVGKTTQEIELALEADILFFVVESEAELMAIRAIAASRGVVARFSIRVNPDIAAATHPYISTGLNSHKFGIPVEEVVALYEKARQWKELEPVAIGFHIGSQIMDHSAHLEAIKRLLSLVERLRQSGIALKYLDAGGGLGISYEGQASPDPASFIAALRNLTDGSGLQLFIEPGRSICGNAGILLTEVLYRKSNRSREFIICNAAMNDLLRPALYSAEHIVLGARQSSATIEADLVGPVCESGDFLAKGRALPDARAGDLLAIFSAGAYGFVMASNYNSRPRPAEVLIEAGKTRLIRRRESMDDLLGPELGL